MHASLLRLKTVFLPLLCLLVTVAGCSDENKSSSKPTSSLFAKPSAAAFQSVSVTRAKELIDSRPGLLILDIRTPQELGEGALKNSTLTPFWTIMQNKLDVPKKTPILLICAVGGRSLAAGQLLVQYGYQEVYSVAGGLAAWKEAGLPVKY